MHLVPAKCLFSILLFATITLAFPAAWGDFNTRNSIGNLVSGASSIQAVGPVRGSHVQSRDLVLHEPGSPGNLTVLRHAPMRPLFYIHQNQLWHYQNETAIWPVNLVNVTKTAELPLQLVVQPRRAGILDTSWRWRGTMLYLDHGLTSSQGLFFICPTTDDQSGVFTFLVSSPTPPGCDPVTLHSFQRQTGQRKTS
ncbi:hypothetical protein AMATHDRAFT_139194 [Amanita thiersii Skay4041]|uniref:Uncharacterized protein n=1 Tax=Amanita thiersii Skay4041 TaxID=703135 RepID=A0A2A9NRH4_9AGAR|nr:hypothetical protein AMATHDRAFT_139194 [Amanita thiersii Skay4041]